MLASRLNYNEADVRYLVRAFQEAHRSGCLRKKVGLYMLLMMGHGNGASHVIHAHNQPPDGKATCEARGECLLRERNGRVGCANTVHAEIVMLATAARQQTPVNGATVYITCKPCLDCAKALTLAGVRRVVYAEVNEVIEPEYMALVDSMEFVQVDGYDLLAEGVRL